ncbi:MAG: hypothetical protein RL560_5 [Actinomycetota bacterium]|jgi:hypothetical protein
MAKKKQTSAEKKAHVEKALAYIADKVKQYGQKEVSVADNPRRVIVQAEGPGRANKISIPAHTLYGNANEDVKGMMEINKARAEVYGGEQRDPLNITQFSKIHGKTLDDHFQKPLAQQMQDEEAALNKLKKAKHISPDANTLDESEKLDTVHHEQDDKGRNFIAFASKGTAGHALYTSGSGVGTKYHIVNTCPGQTDGCGGGIDEHGLVDTSRGNCFAVKSEKQYPAAAIRRACHEQAKFDPAMTKDWILAHAGSMRWAANLADKNNKRLLFRPNVVDESDKSSIYLIKLLNKQRAMKNLPPIISNSYGKTNELHDPENGIFVTYSNTGPKTKHGFSIAENIARDSKRMRSTVFATEGKRDLTNEQGNLTPPKNSYLVTNVRRNSDMDNKMQNAIRYAKYWSRPREQSELSPEEKMEGPEGHYDGNHNPTTPELAHYGHTTVNGQRFDYQKQHILHPRLVQVGHNDDGSPHMIPTDSRFLDDQYLPKDRFMTKNGKKAGAILMTTPTISTTPAEHHTGFFHDVNDNHIQHALQNNGEYVIDPPDEQVRSAGKEYVPPKFVSASSIKKRSGFYTGGAVHGRDNEDDWIGFPERNSATQLHNMHSSIDEDREPHFYPHKRQKRDGVNQLVDRAMQLVANLSTSRSGNR